MTATQFFQQEWTICLSARQNKQNAAEGHDFTMKQSHSCRPLYTSRSATLPCKACKGPFTLLPLSLGGATEGEKCCVKLDPLNKSFKCLTRDVDGPFGSFFNTSFQPFSKV